MIDQPNCAFVPRSLGHFPSYFDGPKSVATGEKLINKNSASVPHNARGLGDGLVNAGFNDLIPAGKEIAFELKPYRNPIPVGCNVHPWMRANIWVFDHPYFAVTKADGSFTMPIVPAGAEFTVMAWHELAGQILGPEGRSMALKEGTNSLDGAVKARSGP